MQHQPILGCIAPFGLVGILAWLRLFVSETPSELVPFVAHPSISSNSIDADQNRRSLRAPTCPRRGCGAYFNPKSVTSRIPLPIVSVPAPTMIPLELLHPTATNSNMTYSEEMICIAAVDDGTVTAAGVVDVTTGYLNLLLPENYEANVTVECSQYNEQRGFEEVVRAFSEKIRYETPVFCDERFFQPGYFDHNNSLWYDACTGNQPPASLTLVQEKGGPQPLLNADNCPKLADIKEDTWVSFLGDSVTRQYFHKGLHGIVGTDVVSWQTGRAGKYPDFILVSIGDPQCDHKVWFSFTFDYAITYEEGDTILEKPLTWGDFMRLRKDGPRDDDPQFQTEKSPDIVFYGGGYHASYLNASQYGAAIEGALTRYQDAFNGHNVSMPPFHFMLNIMVSLFPVIHCLSETS
jgi:hypothetical protein